MLQEVSGRSSSALPVKVPCVRELSKLTCLTSPEVLISRPAIYSDNVQAVKQGKGGWGEGGLQEKKIMI